MKKLLLFVMMLFLVFGCSKNSDELVMVTEAGFAPYEYYRDGEIVGVDVDIAKEIAKYLGINYNTLRSAIPKAIKNNSEYKGYKFEYV